MGCSFKRKKKRNSIVNAFQKIISQKRKPNKKGVDQGSEFYSNSFKNFLKIHKIEMYSTYNEEKSVVAERFIRTLKNKIFKFMTTVLKMLLCWTIQLINTIAQFTEQ